MLTRLLLLLIGIPMLEIYLLLAVGRQIGALPTLGLLILTALLGTAMLRSQSLATWQNVQLQLQRGEMPAQALLEALLLLMGGVLLLIPGFFTDALGFLCLLPWSRRWLAGYFSRQMAWTVVAPQSPSADSAHVAYPQSATIEGECRRDEAA